MGDVIPTEKLSLIRLTKYHDLSNFKCSDDDLDDFLKNDALKYQEQCLAVTYVCIFNEQIVGYMTLCSDSVKFNIDEANQMYKGIKLKDVPAIKLARLAVHIDYHKNGVGKYLVLRCLLMARDVKGQIGVRIVTVEAKGGSVDYYKKLGFRELQKYSGKHRQHPYMYIDIMEE